MGEPRTQRSASWSDGGSDVLSRLDQTVVRPWLTVPTEVAAVKVVAAAASSSDSHHSVEKEYTFSAAPPPLSMRSDVDMMTYL